MDIVRDRRISRNRFDDFPLYRRSPRIIYKINEHKIDIKNPPAIKNISRESIIQTILPALCTMAFTVVIGFVLKRGAFIYMSMGMTLITTVFSAKKLVTQKKENTEYNSRREVKYEQYIIEQGKNIGTMRRHEMEAYDYMSPNNQEIEALISEYSSRLYERGVYDSDFLDVTLGYQIKPTSVKVDSAINELEMSDDSMLMLAGDLKKRGNLPIEVPLSVNIKRSHLGLVGNREYLIETLKSIVYRITFFHSYHDVEIILLCNKSDEPEYRYMRWYPHLKLQSLNLTALISDEQIAEQVIGSIHQILRDRANKLEESNNDNMFIPHLIFIIDSPYMIVNHPIMEFLQGKGEQLGFSIIYTADAQENLPGNIGTVCILDSREYGTLMLEEGERLNRRIRLLNTENLNLEYDARRLASVIHEQGVSSKIPEQISFFGMYGVMKPDELNILSRWKQNQAYKSLAVPLGLRTKDDIVSLNLHEKAHGPHGLVAGTTGSGKSEMVQSYILSLAVNFHPDEVGFLLIDYKGGGMANLFEKLPHLLGTITNLDKTESMRALVSIKSELSRRQRIFGENDVNHINGYNRLYREGKVNEPLPHLFIISDEFAELKKEQPEFMSELVSAARIGRSLGVHLILATQKPSGVVDDQIWTNSRFKLCLKVQNTSDSNEMLHTPDAASIVQPGRAYLQVGNNEIYELFQSAWSGEIYTEESDGEEREDDRVYVINKLGQGELINQDLSGGNTASFGTQTELDATVEYIKSIYDEEVKSGRSACIRKPWLPSLAGMLINPYMKEEIYTDKEFAVNIGLVDIPEEQIQSNYSFDMLREGNLLYIASGGYGKSVFLTNYALELAYKNIVEDLNMYILDFGSNALMPLSELPHVSAYITPDESEKFEKFCTIIEKEIRRRKKLLAAAMAQNYEMYIHTHKDSLPAIVILIDNYNAIKDMDYDTEEFFARVSRDGMALGIYTVATATRLNAIRTAALNNYKIKIAGVNYDEDEIRAIVGRSKYTLSDIKGRAMIKLGDNICLMQLYVPADVADGINYTNKIKEMVLDIRAKSGGKEAEHIPILPDEVTYTAMYAYPAKSEKEIYLGLDADSVLKTGIMLANSPFVILGESLSGKTNALRLILEQVRGYDVTVIDSRSRNLENYSSSCRYVCNNADLEKYSDELADIITSREEELAKAVSAGQSYSEAQRNLVKNVIVIDDLTNMISMAGLGMNTLMSNIVKSVQLGYALFVTENTANFKGVDELSRLLKTCKDGLLLSDQGYITMFPTKASDAPRKPDGVLMVNGMTSRLRIPVVNGQGGLLV